MKRYLITFRFKCTLHYYRKDDKTIELELNEKTHIKDAFTYLYKHYGNNFDGIVCIHQIS